VGTISLLIFGVAIILILSFAPKGARRGWGSPDQAKVRPDSADAWAVI